MAGRLTSPQAVTPAKRSASRGSDNAHGYDDALNHGLMPKDMTARMQVVRAFVEMGGKVSMAAMRDEIGIDEPEDGEELLVVRSGE